jgi:predicted nucleic acid-binding protein
LIGQQRGRLAHAPAPTSARAWSDPRVGLWWRIPRGVSLVFVALARDPPETDAYAALLQLSPALTGTWANPAIDTLRARAFELPVSERPELESIVLEALDWAKGWPNECDRTAAADVDADDPDDALLIAMALAGDADYLVTGDRRAGLLQLGSNARAPGSSS